MTGFDDTMRMQALNSIHGKLSDMIQRPPRLRDGRHTIDIGEIQKRLEEIKPFWQAYIAVAQPRKHQYSLRNINETERNSYLDCEFWFERLSDLVNDTKLGELGEAPIPLPIQGGTA